MGSGFGLWGFGSRIQGLGFEVRVCVLGIRGLSVRIEGREFIDQRVSFETAT